MNKLLSTLLGVPLALCMVVPDAGAGAADAPGVSLIEREAVMAAATQATHERLKLKPGTLRLSADHLKRAGDWVFLTANLRTAAGQRFDYAGTDLAGAAAQGGASDLVAALLRKEGARWHVVDIAVGPTDVAWEGWAAAHHAPAELFK